MNPTASNNLLECPFSHNCALPVKQNSCNFPKFKVCPEYQIKLKKLVSPSKIIN
ncbi:MAG: hypothetical protein ACFE9I_13975 [Candidatus Hermodarchaeota archaeon]